MAGYLACKYKEASFNPRGVWALIDSRLEDWSSSGIYKLVLRLLCTARGGGFFLCGVLPQMFVLGKHCSMDA